MIESAELVVAALAAGATAGMTDTASTAIKESYQGLKSLVAKLLRKSEDDEQLADPEAHRDELVAALTEAGVGPELERKAREVLGSKYVVTMHNCSGVVVGDQKKVSIHIKD